MNFRQTQFSAREKNSVKITIASLVFYMSDAILLGSTAGISKFTAGSYHALFLLVLGLLTWVLLVSFFVHLVFAILSAQKKIHLLMLLLIPITVVTLISTFHKWQRYEHRRWFLQTALPDYQATVEKILQNPSVLKDRERLQVVIDRPVACSYLSGEKRTDGSFVIYFGGGDHWREGYVYYSGGEMNSDTNNFLTNGWFVQ